MENVLDLYKQPYNPDYPVICMIVEWRFTVDDARIKLKKLYPIIGKINSNSRWK